MKSKNVIVLLLSLTLSLVMNAIPTVDRDIGPVTQSVPSEVQFASGNDVYVTIILEPLCEPVFVRTGEVSTLTGNVIVNEARVTILPKCRDVDLCSSVVKTYKNISARTISSRTRTAYLPRGGGSPV